MMVASGRGFGALVAAQALGAFGHNMLRAALLTLLAFRPLDTGDLSPETAAALSTLFIVAPYAVLSLPAGRLADRLPKALLLRAIKAAEIPVFVLAAAGLLSSNAGLMLAALLLAGVCAALFGPAKFGIIPELVAGPSLIAGNAWISATSTLAILGGLIAGSLLALTPAGLSTIASGGVVLSILGWLATLALPRGVPLAPALSLSPRAFASDFTGGLSRLKAFPAIVVPVMGCSWFWFQGAVNTSLIPRYVADAQGVPESAVSLLLIATSVGVTLGAVIAHRLSRRTLSPWFASLALAITTLPGIDLWLAGPMSGPSELWRAALDIALISAGCGLFVVPLGTAVQQLTPPDERARFVGINHTFNGLAMILAGAAMLLLNLPFVSPTSLFAASALVSGSVAAVTLLTTWPMLIARRHELAP